jgi:hypothetical protein
MGAGPIAPPYREVHIAPPYVEAVVVHVDQPTVKPATVAHSRSYGLGDQCAMCVGQHLRNMHGMTTQQLDAIGYRNWTAYLARLHDAMGTPKRGTSGCPGGICPGPVRSFLFPRFR